MTETLANAYAASIIASRTQPTNEWNEEIARLEKALRFRPEAIAEAWKMAGERIGR